VRIIGLRNIGFPQVGHLGDVFTFTRNPLFGNYDGPTLSLPDPGTYSVFLQLTCYGFAPVERFAFAATSTRPAGNFLAVPWEQVTWLPDLSFKIFGIFVADLLFMPVDLNFEEWDLELFV